MKKIILKQAIGLPHWSKLETHGQLLYPWDADGPKTTFKIYCNDSHLHFQFIAEGPAPLVYVKENHKLEVRHSERVELFFRSDVKMQPYYCLEMDPHGRVLDYRAEHYRQFDREWAWPNELGIKVEQKEGVYTLSGRLQLATLQQLDLLKGGRIEMGFYRGHCTAIENDLGIIQWSTWVDPNTEEPDFHVGGSFGVVELR